MHDRRGHNRPLSSYKQTFSVRPLLPKTVHIRLDKHHYLLNFFFIAKYSFFRTNENPVHYKVQIASGDRVPKIEKDETVEIRLNGKNQLRVFHWSLS